MAGDDGLYLDLIGMMEANQDPDTIAPALDDLAKLEPESQRVVVLRASLLEHQGRLVEAAQMLEAFVAGRSDSAVARTNLARLQWKAGQRSLALATLRLGLMKDPNQERPLHLYAALLEEDSNFAGALGSLRLLAGSPGAWLPAWVGAQLAASRQPEEAGPMLLMAARQSQVPFPPNPAGLMQLLEALPSHSQRSLAIELRPYCHQQAQILLDAFLARPQAPNALTEGVAVTVLRRSVWRHLSQPQQMSELGLAPICLIKPESWDVEQVAGRLGRGFALLVAETLDAIAGCSAGVVLETVPGAGVVARDTPQTGALLALQAGDSCRYLISSYLSFRTPNEFILDAEIYDQKGTYLARESCRAAHPGACLQQLAQRLCASLTATADPGPLPPMPDLELDDALAREAVASLLLCSRGALRVNALGNPGSLLDGLVEYAVRGDTAPSLLTLWAGIEAAARAGLSGGQQQRDILTQVLAANDDLAYWTKS
jgi:hypothetical protein